MKKRLHYIITYAKPHWWKFLILFVCIIVTTFIGASFNYLFGRMVDEVFYAKNMSAFVGIVILYAIIYIFNQGMHFALNMSWASLMTRFLFDIRYALYQKIMHAKGRTLSSLYSGDIVSRMSKDVEEFMNFIHWNVFYTVGGVLNLLISIGFIAYINPWLAGLVAILTPISVYISRYFSKKAKPFYENIRKQEGFMASWLFEILKGMQEIRILGASKHIISDFVGKTVKITRLKIDASRVEVLSERINTGISLLGQLTMYAGSVFLIWRGSLTVGGFVACVSYFATCVASFNALNNKATAISGNMVSIDRVIETLTNEEENYNSDSAHNEIKHGNIDFKNIGFFYNAENPVLSDFNLNIKSGEKIALIGKSGAGKSTITSLLLKIYEPNCGQIFVDGIDVNDYQLHSLREQIGIVNQDTVIFDGSIRFNLTFGHGSFSDEQLWNALEKAHLLAYVKGQPYGLDTVIGNGGQGLSGGQKQRLSIARIFLRNPKILVFDEATSSLDSEAESVIKDSWELLCRDRTMIIIAHRLSTILSTDKVAVLANGSLAGFDSHESLLKSCKEYIELFKEQYATGAGRSQSELLAHATRMEGKVDEA